MVLQGIIFFFSFKAIIVCDVIGVEYLHTAFLSLKYVQTEVIVDDYVQFYTMTTLRSLILSQTRFYIQDVAVVHILNKCHSTLLDDGEIIFRRLCTLLK